MNNNMFTINENVKLTFKSKGKDYLMSVNIIEGLIILNEVTNDELKNKSIIFLGEQEDYFGELKKEEVKAVEVKKKRGRKKKK